MRWGVEDTEQLEGTSAAAEVLDPASAVLWGPGGKQFEAGKKLSDYCGRNEKSRVVLKLQRKGAGAPAREPAVSAEEQKEMMSYYHRKQEEHKRFAQSGEEEFAHSAWADPKSLKAAFSGVGELKGVGAISRGTTGFNQGVM